MESVIKEDVGGTVSLYHYDNETVATASQLSDVACTVYWPGGSELIAETEITPETDGEMIMTISSEDAATPDEGYRAHFEYTYGSQVYTEDVWFVVAPTSFSIPAHFPDLLEIVSDLEGYDPADNYHFYKQRNAAEGQLYYRLLNAGHEPHKVLRTGQLKTAFTWLWLKLICEGALRSSPWMEFAQVCDENYEKEFGKVDLIIDDVDTANITNKPILRMGEVRLERG